MAAEIVAINRRTQADTPPVSKYNQVVDLNTAPGTAGAFTVPTGVNHIRVKYSAGLLYVNASGTTAAAPSAAVTNGTAAEPVMQGESFSVAPGQVLSFFNATACWVIVSCRKAAIS